MPEPYDWEDPILPTFDLKIPLDIPNKEEILLQISEVIKPMIAEAVKHQLGLFIIQEFGGTNLKEFATSLFKTWLKTPIAKPLGFPDFDDAREASPIITQEETLVFRLDSFLKEVVTSSGKQRRDYLIGLMLAEYPDMLTHLRTVVRHNITNSDVTLRLLMDIHEEVKKLLPEDPQPTPEGET